MTSPLKIASKKGQSGRNTVVVRVLTLVALLREPRTLESLADELEVCTRTIRRDLDAIRAVGFRIVQKGPRWQIVLPC